MNKLRFMIITLVITLLTFAVGSFAWLQISNINILDGIDLDVAMGDKLEISLDGINYTKKLSEDDFKPLIKKLRFKDITSSNGTNFYRGHNYSNNQAIKNVDYISLELHFRVIPESGSNVENIYDEVYLVNHKDPAYDDASDTLGTFISSKGKVWKSDQTFNNGTEVVNKGDTSVYYAKDAMRIGFTSVSNTFIYDVSENEQRGYGANFGAFEYYNLKNKNKRLELPKVVPNTIYSLSNEIHKTGLVDSQDSLIVKLESIDNYYKGSSTVNIWLEGWDADAFDAILSDHMLMQLEFMVSKYIKTK